VRCLLLGKPRIRPTRVCVGVRQGQSVPGGNTVTICLGDHPLQAAGRGVRYRAESVLRMLGAMRTTETYEAGPGRVIARYGQDMRGLKLKMESLWQPSRATLS